MISALTFFGGLNWIDGGPLQIEDYRKEIFQKSLDTYREDGVPQYTLVLAGRGKKNNKSLDLILGGLYCLMCRSDPRGSDVLIVANDKDQADQDLDLCKKLVRVNNLDRDDGELEILADEIRRKDGRGAMRILAANNVIGQHGKTAAFLGFDEIHGYKDHALFEALAPDPTRYCLVWVTSYDSIYDTPGYPLHDYKQIGIAGTDDRMLFSWYSGDRCTDPAFANLEPELRANPSIGSWPEGRADILSSNVGAFHPLTSAACISICPAPLQAPSSIKASSNAPSSSAERFSNRKTESIFLPSSICRAVQPMTQPAE
jgi:hypothetical protein